MTKVRQIEFKFQVISGPSEGREGDATPAEPAMGTAGSDHGLRHPWG